jgi:hypothetical protein
MKQVDPARLSRLAAAALLALLAGGCGYSATAEYSSIRSIVVPAAPGDGSVIAAMAPASGRDASARAFADNDRARVSDSIGAGN